jgi:hypothetical protein
MRKFLLTVSVLAMLGLLLPTMSFADICSSIPGNLLVNCGFETGTFSGWTQSGNTAFTSVETAGFQAYLPHSGTFFAALGPIGSDGFLSQTVTDTTGATYKIGGYLSSDGVFPNNFDIQWDGVTVYSAVNLPATRPNYNLLSFDVLGTGSDTITFSFRDDPSYLALDDTFVAPATVVPEPCYLAVLLAASAVLLFARKRRQTQA